MGGGQASINNVLDDYDFGGMKLKPGDYFGTTKFIYAQGFSYFGDIIAYAEPKQDVKDIKKKLVNQARLISSNVSNSLSMGMSKTKSTMGGGPAGMQKGASAAVRSKNSSKAENPG